jgi:hypothetical protein
MKKQIALVLAGTAASIAGGLRLVQELVDRGDRGHADPAAPSTADPVPASSPAPTAETSESETAGSTGAGRPEASGAPAGASKAELYEIATELKISGRSKMSKAELIEAINSAG